MSTKLKFEFDFDEVFEGIKLGAIKQLSELNFENATESVKNEMKNELKQKICIRYSDINELKEEIKDEIKKEVYSQLLEEGKKNILPCYQEEFQKDLLDSIDEEKQKFSEKLFEEMYEDMYEDIKSDLAIGLTSKISKALENISGEKIEFNGSTKRISVDEYNNLKKRSETLAALEQGGVDNWEWYGESLRDYFGDKEDD